MGKHRFLSLALMAAGFFTFAVGAQTPDAGSAQYLPRALHETLKDIPVASTACRKEDFVASPGKITRSIRQADPSCAISLEQVSPFLGKSDTMLIDVRQKAAFDNSHIDDAINFSASEIRTKRYLANKFIVLLGDGKGDEDLYQLCAELKGAGFKQVRVLKGGMLAWALDGLPVVGDPIDFSDLARLSAADLFRESKVSNNLVISLANGSKLSDVIPMAKNSPGNDVASIKAFIKKQKKLAGPYSIVIVADERFDRGQAIEFAKLAKPTPLLVFNESEASYRQFLRVQNAMWMKQAKGPARPRCGM